MFDDDEYDEAPRGRHKRKRQEMLKRRAGEYEYLDPDDSDEISEEDEFECLPMREQLRQLAREIDDARERLAVKQLKVDRELSRQPRMREYWAEFTSAGGVTADDLDQFIAGRFRYRRTRQQKHLRLVVSKPPPKIKLRQPPQSRKAEAAKQLEEMRTGLEKIFADADRANKRMTHDASKCDCFVCQIRRLVCHKEDGYKLHPQREAMEFMRKQTP
jgi:hypothetical protein